MERCGRRATHYLLTLMLLLAATAAAHAEALPVSSFPSPAESAFWRVAVKKIMMRPGCCGACASLEAKDFRAIATVIRSDARDTAATRATWRTYGPRLAFILQRQDPEGYREYAAIVRATLSTSSK